MGCASSKPSSSSSSKQNKKEANTANGKQQKSDKNSKNKQQQQQQQQQHHHQQKNGAGANDHHANKVATIDKIKNEQIKVDKSVLDQIEANQDKVNDYILKIVRKELNAELVTNGSGNTNFAAVIAAAASAQENDGLIIDVAHKAIYLIKTGRCSTTYKNLNDSLKSSHYLCKNQAHKNRICDLTTETIRNCLSAINDENNKFTNIMDLINNDSHHQQQEHVTDDNNNNLTEKVEATPVKQHQSSQDKYQWNDAVLLSRAEANEVARMLFYSNKARPVVHASPKAKDAYFVNKQINDEVEVTVGQDEIDEILRTFNQPTFQPPLRHQTLNIYSNNNNNVNGDDSPPTKRNVINLTVNGQHHDEDGDQVEEVEIVEDFHQEEHLTNTDESINFINPNDLTHVTSNENEYDASNADAIEEAYSKFNQIANEFIEKNDGQLNESAGNDDDDVEDENGLEACPINTYVAIQTLASNLLNQNDTSFSTSSQQDSTSLNLNTDNNANNNNNTNLELLSTTTAEAQTIILTDGNNNKQIVSETITITETNTVNTNNNTISNYEDANTSLNSNNNVNNNTNDEFYSSSNLDNQTSDGGTLDPIVKQSLLDDRYYNNHSFKEDPPVNDVDRANAAATTIQAGFKGHSVRQEQQDSKQQQAGDQNQTETDI